MIKYLECPDMHNDSRWLDVATENIKCILKEDADFITIPGDWFNRPVYASDDSGFNKMRDLMKELLKKCPVCAIEGTPGHEAPGVLKSFEDLGLVVLRPYNIFGYFKDKNTIKEVIVGENPDCLIFGQPELNKNNIQAKLNLTAEEANAKAEESFYKYITEFVAVGRAARPNTPAIMLFHGMLSDSKKENSNDIITRASDIIIHTEELRIANLTRISAGHIHGPWESKVMSAGYAGFAGIDNNPWAPGKLGFKPGFNKVEISNDLNVSISRCNYSTPERQKITTKLNKYSPDIAYWLDRSDLKHILPDNVHPWSRTTDKEKNTKTKRITKKEADQVKSLSDLFKLIDPKNITDDIISKVDSIESEIGIPEHQKSEAVLDYVEIDGCIFFKGNKISLDIKNTKDGLTNISGDNGSGKSSLLSFCSWYPIVIGKDTLSGRPSAIKDFFDKSGSYILKRGTFNGEIHEHLITIKAAHTKSPKTECYIKINGVSATAKPMGFDDMLARCEEIYGPYKDYLLTSFYIQPLQGKQDTGLMTATMTEIRNLVQSIAGINREDEKQYALEKVSELDRQIKEHKTWIEAAVSFNINEDELKSELLKHNEKVVDLNSQVDIFQKQKSVEDDNNKTLLIKNADSSSEEKRKENDLIKLDELKNKLAETKQFIVNQNAVLQQLDVNKKTLSDDDKLTSQIKLYEDKKREVDQYNEDLTRDYNQKKNDLGNKVEAEKLTLDAENNSVEILSKACPKCGYIDEKSKAKITKHKLLAGDSILRLRSLSADFAELKPPTLKTLDLFPPTDKPLSTHERSEIENFIRLGLGAEAQIISARDKIFTLEKEIKQLESEKYNITPGLSNLILESNAKLSEINQSITTLQDEINLKKVAIQNINYKLSENKKIKDKIIYIEKQISDKTKHYTSWKYIAMMLQPNKIPALELEIVADFIDESATEIIKPLQSGRYWFETITQSEGKKKTIDKFDIIVHDTVQGIKKSFIQHSPGEKAFFSDAYTKALIKQRNQRAKRFYSPIIMDESDGPIQPERIEAYYDMQKDYWDNNKVFVVSHNPASHQYLENIITMEELQNE